MLTPRQRALLDFISAYIAEHRYAPTLQEMAVGIGLKTAGAIHRTVLQLEARGFIRRISDRHRAIEVARP